VPLDTIRHQAALAGVVTVAATGLPLAGARVELTSGPPAFLDGLAVRAALAGPLWDALALRPDRTRTAADGRFRFIDLLDGLYTIAASVPGGGSRFSVTGAQVTVARDSNGTIVMATAVLAVPTTSLSGTITDTSTPAKPLVMAEVRLKGSGERTYTDGQGKYLLVALEAGNRTVVVAAPGHKAVAQAVTLGPPGVGKTLDFVVP
jgi:CarboxypepD_reg-like domain/Carboxypeptidase regulatory-like domain